MWLFYIYWITRKHAISGYIYRYRDINQKILAVSPSPNATHKSFNASCLPITPPQHTFPKSQDVDRMDAGGCGVWQGLDMWWLGGWGAYARSFYHRNCQLILPPPPPPPTSPILPQGAPPSLSSHAGPHPMLARAGWLTTTHERGTHTHARGHVCFVAGGWKKKKNKKSLVSG